MKQKVITFLKGEVFAYLFFGVCTTAVNFITFTVLYRFLNLGLSLSNFTGIAISILFAFFTNKILVFKSKCVNSKEYFKEFIRFVSGRIFTMMLEIFGLLALVEIFFLNEYISKAFLQIAVIISNFFISKFLVFKKSQKKK